MTGKKITFDYDAEYTYGYPKSVLKTHDEIINFYKGLKSLYYGKPTDYLNSMRDIAIRSDLEKNDVKALVIEMEKEESILHIDLKLDLIFDFFDLHQGNENFGICDNFIIALLKSNDIKQISTNIFVGVLTITADYKNIIGVRHHVYNEVRKRYVGEREEEGNEILKGLE